MMIWIEACPECGHTRCEDCPVERVKKDRKGKRCMSLYESMLFHADGFVAQLPDRQPDR